MKSRRNGGALETEPHPDLPGPTPEALTHHVFEGLSDSDKLDRLLSLYSGVVSKVEGLRMVQANREAELQQKLGQLDYVVKCQKLIMAALNIPAPTEPPPPLPPNRRRSDA